VIGAKVGVNSLLIPTLARSIKRRFRPPQGGLNFWHNLFYARNSKARPIRKIVDDVPSDVQIPLIQRSKFLTKAHPARLAG
jgi:hypothetical protein